MDFIIIFPTGFLKVFKCNFDTKSNLQFCFLDDFSKKTKMLNNIVFLN